MIWANGSIFLGHLAYCKIVSIATVTHHILIKLSVLDIELLNASCYSTSENNVCCNLVLELQF